MQRRSLDLAGDAFPGQEPQALSDDEQQVPTDLARSEYKFFYGNGHLEVAPGHMFEHDDLAGHLSLKPDHTGPMALGYITVVNGQATWQVKTNVHAKGISRVLKDYTKAAGWKWGGMTDIEGEPVGVGSEFAPTKSYVYDYTDRLLLSKTGSSLERIAGEISVSGTQAEIEGAVNFEIFESIQDWARDAGLTLVAGNDNVIKTIEDLQMDNIYSPEQLQEDRQFFPKSDDRQPGGVFKCPDCGKIFPRWRLYMLHREQELPNSDDQPDGKFPELNPDATFPPNSTEMQPAGFESISSWHEAVSDKPKDLITGHIPFIFDIEEDAIHIGQPGTLTTAIPGKFTPGGIVEGIYEPGGKVTIKSMTNMPYTVRHMLELWYWQHPELEVTSVKLQDDAGNTTKLARTAGADIGGYIASLVAADKDTWTAYKALEKAGGKVYVVGGAVRDALSGSEPKDLDLLVQGLKPNEVRDALKALPGRLDLTGKDFGVFRYNGDVEVALPRRERSTGNAYADFDVTVEPDLPVEKDLFRRDFTVNAMAVDLSNGRLIDPYGGHHDIQKKILKTLSPQSLREDPVRTLRALAAKSRYGFDPDEDTLRQMKHNASGILNQPRERWQTELDKLMKGKDPAGALKLAHDTGILSIIFPEVSEAMGFDQNNPHHERELGDHLLEVLRRTAELTDDPDVRYAALLHDVGKPASAWQDPETGMNHYYRGPDGQGANHEDVGAELAEQRLRDLKFPADRTKRVRDLVQHHMWKAYTTPKGARKFLNRVGDHADDLFILREADQGGKTYDNPSGIKQGLPDLDRQKAMLDQVRNAGEPTDRSQLAITGNDLIQWGYPPGPQLGAILNYLTQQVIENPSLNTPEQLKGLVDQWVNA